jgi:hypothetical protein
MPGNRFLISSETGQRPFTSGPRIRHRFQRGESFRRNDEEGLRRVEIQHGFGEIGPVYVRNETEGHRSLAIMLQRFVGHDRPEIRAADSDIDDITNAFAGMTFPFAAPHPVAELGHLIEDGVDLRDDVLAIDGNGCAPRCAQRYV